MRRVALLLGALALWMGGCDWLSQEQSGSALEVYLTTEQQTGQLPSLSVQDTGPTVAHDDGRRGPRFGRFPYDSIAAATIVVREVKVYGRQQRGTTVLSSSKPINLLDIKNELGVLLGQAQIRPDTIRALELTVDQGEITLKDGRKFSLRVPGTNGRLLVLFHPPLVVQQGQTIQITIEFDISRSFVAVRDPATGSIREFLFSPVIRPVRAKATGFGTGGRGR